MSAETPPPPRITELVQLLLETDPNSIGPGNVVPLPPAAPGFTTAAPRFLYALDSLDNDVQGFLADCPICTCEGMTIRPDHNERIWRFACEDGCSHEEVVRWLQCDVRLYPDEDDEWMTKAWMAIMLAPTVEICEALMRDEKVAEHRLDQQWLTRFKAAGLMT